MQIWFRAQDVAVLLLLLLLLLFAAVASCFEMGRP